MSDFKPLYQALEQTAAKLGWTLAVAEQKQDDPEQWLLVVTREDPAKALFQKTFGVHVSDGIKAEDKFGGA